MPLPNNSWRPTTSLDTLKLRAQLLAKIRSFFSKRNVLEVETPLLSQATITDPNLHSITAYYCPPGSKAKQQLYLQTSPEFAMKRLLAAGSGCIYQLCKAFRDEEAGRQHNPEFTILEWYRLGFDHHHLMNEVGELLQATLNTKPAERFTYAEIFEKYLQVNPHDSPVTSLKTCALKHNITEIPGLDPSDKDGWLHILLTHLIEPHLGQECPTFIYDFPITQVALARIRPGNPPVAERFEVYIKGIELANGFHELANASVQRQRFIDNLAKRKELNLPPVPIDDHLIAALAHGLPDCAGVALGVDRLLMLACKAKSIDEVLSFPIDRA